jgi:ABC-2 type transport system permease protein
MQGAVFLAMAPLAGIHLSLGAIVVSLAMMGLIAFAMTSIGLAMAWRTESTQGFHAFMNMLLLPIWMLSGAVFPVAGAPGWFQWTTRLNPLTYAVDALRQGLYLAEPASSGATMPMASAVAVAIAFAAFAFLLATRVARTASTI